MVKVEEKDSQSGGEGYLNWTLRITAPEGSAVGKNLKHMTSLKPQALFNLKNTLEAMGIEVKGEKLKLKLKSYEGNVIGVSTEQEVYQGRKQSRIIEVFNAEDWDERQTDEDEDEEDEDEEADDDEEDEDEEDEDEGDDDSSESDDDDDEEDDEDEEDEEDEE